MIEFGARALRAGDHLAALCRRAPALTLPWAVVLGAALIGTAVLLTSFVAPYRFAGPSFDTFWRFNAVTGEAVQCSVNLFEAVCAEPIRVEDRAWKRVLQEGSK